MRMLLSLCALITLCFSAGYAQAKTLTLDAGYLRQDGAIVTLNGANNRVDPYFPTKALLLAHDHGMDIKEIAQRWIYWMLVHQEANGLFSRYCIDDVNQVYRSCDVADADDSMMSMWMELLYRMAPDEGLPEKWQESFDKAATQLDMLHDHKQNIYVISLALPVGLLMDNIEVYAAFKRIETHARRMKNHEVAEMYNQKASKLKAGIIKTFWDHGSKRYIASTQDRKELTFYPDTVVQLIPMLHGFNLHFVRAHKKLYKSWMNQHRAEWFGLIGKEYPWGILAVLAMDKNDIKTSYCWYIKSKPYRHGALWSVMDEAAFQIVEDRLLAEGMTKNMKCEGSYS